jgi:hypothetical protein
MILYHYELLLHFLCHDTHTGLIVFSSCTSGEDPLLSDQQHYRYMTVDDMKSLGDDSLQIDVTRDERAESNRVSMGKDW